MVYDPTFPMSVLSFMFWTVVYVGVPFAWIVWICIFLDNYHTRRERRNFALLQLGLVFLAILLTGFFIKI